MSRGRHESWSWNDHSMYMDTLRVLRCDLFRPTGWPPAIDPSQLVDCFKLNLFQLVDLSKLSDLLKLVK